MGEFNFTLKRVYCQYILSKNPIFLHFFTTLGQPRSALVFFARTLENSRLLTGAHDEKIEFLRFFLQNVATRVKFQALEHGFLP